jgi:DNA repair exonuclease SbcCD ATPase subunit
MAENDNSIKADLEAINTKKDSTSTISFRLPTWLKAKVLEVADSKGQSPSGFSSFVVYKATMEGIVSQEDYNQLKEELEELKEEYEGLRSKNENESNLLEKATAEAEKAQKECDKLEEKVNELKKRPTQNQLDKLQKKLDDKIEELNKYKEKAKENENARKSEAMKREDLERRIKEANAWAERTPFIDKRF